MDREEYLKITVSGKEALAAAIEQSEHPVMERLGDLLRATAAREGLDLSGPPLRVEQIQTRLFGKKILSLAKPGSFLEIGCGFDPLLLADALISRRAFLDLFFNGLKKAREEMSTTGPWEKSIFLQSDLNAPLPFRNNSFDNLFMVNTSGAIKDYPSFAREVWRILQPEGRFFICGDAEPNTLPGSSGNFYLHNRLLAHEILKIVKEDFSPKIYVAGPALPLPELREYRLASERGMPLAPGSLKPAEFILQEATGRMVKLSSGREVKTDKEYWELTEADAKSGRKYFAAFLRIVVAEKRLASRSWRHLTELERDYVKARLQPDPADGDLLRQLEDLSQKKPRWDTEALKAQLRKLEAEGPSMDIFSLKRTFPQVFSSKKKIRHPLQECLQWVEREIERASEEGPDERMKKFQNRPEVQRALVKAKFAENPLEDNANRLMREMEL